MANLKLLDFYKILSSITAAYPTPSYSAGFPVNTQPQTFAVINQPAELNSENFSKSQIYQEKPFFFSRNNSTAKIIADYPAIVLLQMDSLLDLSNSANEIDFELLFLDKKSSLINGTENYNNGNVLANRTHEEIISDLYELAKDFLKELKQFVYAYIQYPSPNPAINVWASNAYLSQEKAAGRILSFSIASKFSDHFNNSSSISLGTMLSVETTTAQTLGVVARLKIRMIDCAARPNFNYTAIEKKYNPTIC